MKRASQWVFVTAVFAAVTACAAPFARWIETTAPNGTPIRVYGEGDEFYAWFEAPDGHAVRFGADLDAYEYVRAAEDGSLEGTGIAVGDEAGHESELAAIPLHLRDESEACAREVADRMEAFESEMGVRDAWLNLKLASSAREAMAASSDAPLLRPPSTPTRGRVVGCTLLIDFPSETNSATTLWQEVHPDITALDLADMINAGEGIQPIGNTRSVRQYYHDMSLGTLEYTNIILGPVLMPNPRSYYDQRQTDCGLCGKMLIQDALGIVTNDADFATEIAPVIRTLSLDDSSYVRAFNVYYAGEDAAAWGFGLWPHSANVEIPTGVQAPNGSEISFNRYQITAITQTPTIFTFCHENGHMVCGFPDLYSIYGMRHSMASTRCLMGATPAGETNPPAISAYLRYKAGWVDPVELPSCGNVSLPRDLGIVRKYSNPSDPNEYYLLENRGGFLDAEMKGSGIIIWHCDEAGDNRGVKNWNSAFPANTRILNTELTMEQADGCYDMENARPLNDEDFWFRGNSARLYGGEFSDTSTPTARWKDNADSGLKLTRFSALGDAMSFYVGNVPAFVPGSLEFGTRTVQGEPCDTLSLSISSPATNLYYTVYAAPTLNGPFAPVDVLWNGSWVRSIRLDSAAPSLPLVLAIDPAAPSLFVRAAISETEPTNP